MMWWDGNSGGWGAGMMVFMILFWVALIGLAVWAVLRLTGGGQRQTPPGPDDQVDSARHILDRRFASGDIDAEQYAQMRRVLEGRGTERASH
jgi:putative membrane protein